MSDLRDVARLAGISTTTVSHALNGSRRVHPETHRRIMCAVDQLDYRPNILARSLRRHKTGTIGLLVSDIELPYFTEIARAVETSAYTRGYNVVLCNTDESPDKEALYAEILLGKQVEGLILAPSPGSHEHLQAHVARGARIVFINRRVSGINAPAIVCDDTESTFALTRRLIADGHRRLGAIIGLDGVSTTERRYRGFRGALDAAGIQPDSAWVFPGGSRREGGERAAVALAQLPDPPTANVAFNTAMIEGLLIGLLDHAPNLLDSTIVTGFGYSPMMRLCGTSPYAIDAPTREIGRVATKLLLDGLEDGATWHTNEVILQAPVIELEVYRRQTNDVLTR